jgi:DeoR family fructose operon transcriptional repressor
MIPFIRRQKILDLLNEKDIVYIEDIVKATNVSDATVRRDMKTLYEEGYIDLLSGGAAKLRTQMGERPLPERVLINKEEKEILGKYAASLVNDGDFIFIGPGTTENTMIPYLAGKNITLVTNGAFHIQSCIENQIDTIILGGRIINSIAVLSGLSAIDQVKSMHFNKCFIGCSGITYEGRLTTSDENVANINREAINNSNSVFFLADSSKLGKASRFEFCSMQPHHNFITTKKFEEFLCDCNVIIADER